MNGVMPIARKLGELLGSRETIEPLEPIPTQQFRLRRKDIWPADVWEEIQAIQRGERDGGPNQ